MTGELGSMYVYLWDLVSKRGLNPHLPLWEFSRYYRKYRDQEIVVIILTPVEASYQK